VKLRKFILGSHCASMATRGDVSLTATYGDQWLRAITGEMDACSCRKILPSFSVADLAALMLLADRVCRWRKLLYCLIAENAVASITRPGVNPSVTQNWGR
jgi:hypothetical protein